LQESGRQSQAQFDQAELPLESTPEKDVGLSLSLINAIPSIEEVLLEGVASTY
jgi:hypothetical protein